MLKYKGKYASCKVMIDTLEPEALTQIYSFLNNEAFAGATIRIMPDVHAGAGAVIGFTTTLTDKIIPNVVGVDIGCGVLSVCLGAVAFPDFSVFDRYVRDHVPSGFSKRDTLTKEVKALGDKYAQVAKVTGQDEHLVLLSLGTLGGGNHFVELGSDQQNNVWLTIHTGSRNFGLRIANHHQRKAVRTVGRGNGLEWLTGEPAELYLAHAKVAQEYAAVNRKLIVIELLKYFGRKLSDVTAIECVHNYINFEDKIIRKGAISAHKNEKVIIPWNMRDGLIIGEGLGNPDWNYSAPHGAGRIMGRGNAKRALDVKEFEKSMQGIWSSCISKGTIDESPMVYKDYKVIQEAIGGSVKVLYTVKPIYNFKASEEPIPA